MFLKKRSKGGWFLRGIGCGMILLLLLLGALLLYMRHEAKLLPVYRIEVSSEEWTLPPIKVAVAADFHIAPGTEALERVRKAVDLINAEAPDLILLPGDFAARTRPEHSAPPKLIAEEFARLKAPLGVYVVLGNHDHWHGKESYIAAFTKAGVPLLEDRRIMLEHQGRKFYLLGVSDRWKLTAEEWTKLLPGKNEAQLPRIVATHTPDVYATMPEGTALAVAGHTHGGQIVIPLYGAPVIPSRYGQRYASGIIKEGRNTIFVTRGVGTSILPLRLFCPPELAILTLSGPTAPVAEPMAIPPEPQLPR